MVEPHLANLQMMHSFIGAMNQAIMAACNYPLDTNLVDKVRLSKVFYKFV